MGIIRIIWILSMLAFLAVLLSTLVYLPLNLDVLGINLSRDVYFFSWLSLITFFNSLILIITRLVRGIPASIIPMPAREFWMASRSNLELFHAHFSYWLRGIALGLNLCFVVLAFTVYTFYDPYVNTNTLPFILGLLGLTFAWLIAYFPLFSFLAKDLAEE